MTREIPPPRWRSRALIASLAVNVAVIAAVIGALATGGPEVRGADGRRGGGPPEIAALARGLDRDDRQALFRALRENGRLAGGRERMRAARTATGAALRATPFDRTAFVDAMEAQRSLQRAQVEAGVEILADILSGLTPDARAALADRIEMAWRDRR